MMKTAVLCILLLLQLSAVLNANIPKGCYLPLGMKNKTIPDTSIKATTAILNSTSKARLHYIAQNGERGAWSPSSGELGQWIQVDLGNITMVTMIATQGRQGADEWVTEYKVSYSLDDGGYFKFYQHASNSNSDQEVFEGNSDDNTIEVNVFIPSIVARFIRVHPLKFNLRTSLRMELFGCHSGFPTPKLPVCEAGLGLESYAIPYSSLTASTGIATHGRLHFFPKSGEVGWAVSLNSRDSNWFQVNFSGWTKVTRICTQGGQDEWVSKYRVSYSYDGVFFKYYIENGDDAKTFDGNADGYTVVSHKLKNPIITRYIRIIPVVDGTEWIALRADFYGCKSGFTIPQIPGCRTPLGMENGRIANEYITASSQRDPNTRPENARLKFTGAWIPLKSDHLQWLQVNFGAEMRITGISTQGHDDYFTFRVKKYTLRYSNDGTKFQQYQPELYTKTFSGNTDGNNVVTHELAPPIHARYIRVIPEAWQNFIALRVEFYGCLASSAPTTENKPDLSNPTTPAPYCERDMGMESFAIPDSSVTASSTFGPNPPGHGRLHFFTRRPINGWVAIPSNRYGSWFQVDFGRWTRITRIATQGRYDAPEWVTKYRVSYGYDGIFFRDYQENGEYAKIFDGNTNQNTVVSHTLKNPIITRYIRINPVGFHYHVSLRAEFYGCRTGFAIPKIPGCRAPLGMENGKISNESIKASSSKESWFAGPDNARLHLKAAPGLRFGAWMPQVHDRNQWLQVEFGDETRVTGTSTQGHYNVHWWVKSYSLRYSNDGLNFTEYQPKLHTKIFTGNTDHNNLASHELVPPIQARYIRVVPESWHFLIALRVEFYGCLAVLARNGGYTQWSNWTHCSVTCGVGSRSRGRTCTNPPPGPYGNDCSELGSENQTAECNSGVDCPKLENINQTARCNGSSCTGSLEPTETKPDSRRTVVYVSISVGILVILVLLIGLLKYLLYRRKRLSSPPEFRYNAFIIYSQEDSRWVNEKLLPFLEERNHLKCCIHYRDFTPGKPFTESMAESVYNSYKIIAVLSRNFVKSNYCSYELNIAKYRLLNKRDDSLIIIKIDKESDCRKLPRQLRQRNFIDYSNSLERPLWESKLLRFLNVQDNSNDQDTTEGQSSGNNINSNDVCIKNDGNTKRNRGNITKHAIQNDDAEMHIMELETEI